ncbi:MAG: hypothetical protein KKE17_05870 [Proteobacteria bacterium]|nr:hypothetical protein [Pseudomonadota bacterium]MBU1709515.1 hypothetical protein [Pseudomonadota bacterium]
MSILADFNTFSLSLLMSLLVILQMTSITAGAEEAEKTETVSFEYELDAYYSNVGLYVSLTDKPIAFAGEKSEFQIYRDLFYSSYVPRFAVVEASVNPLPCLGLFIKNNYEDFYDDAEASSDINLIQAVTAGFEEPYAFSIFLGNVISFRKPGETGLVPNKGYMGYLISAGNYHIKDNDAISDNWLELEWKIKGDRKVEKQRLSWSFRVGGKMHGNQYITDVFYVSLRRSRIDYEASWLSLMQNSGFEFTLKFDAAEMNLVQNTFFVSKKWPMQKVAALTIDIGYIWEANRKYSGYLRDDEKNDLSFIMRPNIEF